MSTTQTIPANQFAISARTMSLSPKHTRTLRTTTVPSARRRSPARVLRLLIKNGTTIALIASKSRLEANLMFTNASCSRCGKDFPDGNFVDLNDRPYCRPCANQVGNSSPKSGHNHGSGNNNPAGYIVCFRFLYLTTP